MEKIKQSSKPPPFSVAPIPPGAAIPGVLAQSHPLAPRTVPLQPQPFPYGTPPFFQSMNKRRGKWTAEEEEYALFIIQEFEKGALRECENGITLRAFLSRKLHCAPMRISKKYAGKSIGKLVFCLKSTVDEATLAAVDKKLKELEVKFYRSLYEEMHPSQLQAVMAHYRPQMTIPPVPTAFIPQPVIMQPTMAANTMASAQQLLQAQASAIHAKSLQQTYLNALNQVVNSNWQPTAPLNNNGTTTAVVTQQAPISPAVMTQQAPSVSFVAPMPPLNRSMAAQLPAVNAAAFAPKPQQPRLSSEVPDFLSGFEKVSGEDHRSPWRMPGAPLFGGLQGNGVPLQCSPPITSKSFDDLHQLLCSELSPKPLDLNACRKNSGYMQQPSPQCSPTLTNNADIYAAFAQQSADAVSQHSAYSRMDRSLAESSSVHPVAPAAAKDMSLDFAALYGSQPVMNRANLRVLQGQQSNGGAKPKLNSQTLFASNGARLVSGSEGSSDVGSNEDGGSMHGSSASNNGTSDTTSNDSDSNSDGGHPRKKSKTWGDNAISAVQAASPVSADWSSPREQ